MSAELSASNAVLSSTPASPDEPSVPTNQSPSGTLPADDYRTLIESFAQAVWETDAAGRIVADSPTWRACTGQTLDAWLSEGWAGAVHPDDRAYALRQWQEAVQSNRPVNAEFRLRSPDGGYRWTNVRATAIRNADGSIQKWLGLNIDISDRKRTEEQLRQSDIMRGTLAENLPGGAAFIVDRDLRYQLAEGEALAEVGVTPAHLVGKTIFEVLGAEMAARYEPLYRQALAGEPFTYEHVVNAHSFWSKGVPLRDDSGRIYAVLAVSYDITERKRAEEALRESEERLRLATEAADMYAWEIDLRTGTPKFSPNAERVAGQPLSASFDENLRGIHPDDRAVVRGAFAEAATNGTDQFDYEMRTPMPDGPVRWFRVSGVLVRDGQAEPIRAVGISQNITARKQGEEALREANERFRIAEKATNGFIYDWDTPNGTVTRSEGFYRMLGYQPGDVPETADAWIALIHPDDRAVVSATAPAALNAGQNGFDLEYRVRAKDGKYRYVLDRALAIRDDAETVIRVVGSTVDVTDQKRAAETQRELDERFRTLVQNLPDYAIFRVDPNGLVTEWTEGAQRVKGYTADEVIGQPLALFYPPEALAAGELDNELAQAAETGRAERESVRIRKGGERLWVNEICTAIRDGDGRLVGFTKISRDITERKRAEAALRQSEERLRIVLEGITEHAIVTTDVNGLITGWNPGAQQVFGWSADEALGKPVALIFTPEDRASGQPEGEMQTARQQGRAADERYHIRKDGSRFYVSGVTSLLYDGAGQLMGYVKVARDLTERRQMEEALREADRRKDEFLAMLAHELRNPLAPIQNILQILTLTAGEDETVRSAVDMMSRQVDHLVRLIDDLLDVSRISRGKIDLRRERLDLTALVRQATDAARPLYDNRRRRLHVQLPAQPLYVNGDATRLTQVVTNLLTNGVRYTGEARDGGPGQVWLVLEPAAGNAVLRVRDNGIGLAAEQLDRIFDLFVQVDNSLARSQGGLGVGLTLVKRLVEMHGGRVEARSAGLGQGSEFWVHLPLLPESSTFMNTRESTQTAAPGRRILVVDDNRDAADTLSMLLTLKKNDVHVRYGGREAVEAAETLRPDVILLDIGMPELDGYQTARLIRQQPWGKDLVLIALTGYGQDEDKRRSAEAGFDGHLVKPVDLAALTQLLAERLPRSNAG